MLVAMLPCCCDCEGDDAKTRLSLASQASASATICRHATDTRGQAVINEERDE